MASLRLVMAVGMAAAGGGEAMGEVVVAEEVAMSFRDPRHSNG